MIYFSDFSGGGGPNPYGLVGVASAPGAIGGGGSQTVNIPYPAGLKAGDIAVVHVMLVEFSNPVSYGTLPTGYVEYVHQPIGNSSGAYNYYMFWKRLDGTESGNWSLSMSGSGSTTVRLGMMSVWGGCIGTGDPFDNQVYARSTSTNCVSSALTTASNNEIVVNLIAQEDNRTFTPPSGYTEAYDYNTSAVSGQDCSITMNYKTVVSAGSVAASTTVSTGSNRYGVISFGLKPA